MVMPRTLLPLLQRVAIITVQCWRKCPESKLQKCPKKAIMEIWDIWPYLYTSFLLDSDTPPQTRWCMGGNVSQVWNHLDTSIYLLKDKQPGPNIEGNGLDDPQWPRHGKRPASISCQVCLLISLPNPKEMIIWGPRFLSLAAFFHQATTNNRRSCQVQLAGIRFLMRWRQYKISDVLVMLETTWNILYLVIGWSASLLLHGRSNPIYAQLDRKTTSHQDTSTTSFPPPWNSHHLQGPPLTLSCHSSDWDAQRWS